MAITKLKSTRDFVRIWFFWKIQAILLFCVIVIAICSYSFTATPMYQGTAKIMVLPRPNDESVVSPGNDSRQYLSRAVTSADINTEIELLKSEIVINNTIKFYSKNGDEEQQLVPQKSIFDRLKLVGKPLTKKEKMAKTLLGALNVDPVLSSNIITVSLQSPYQDQVADVLNTLLDTYIKYRVITYSMGDTETFYDDQKDYYGKKLAEASKKLKSFSSRWNILNMESQTTASLELIATFQKELKNLEITIAETEAKIDMIKNGFQISGDKFTISREMRSMPVIVELAKGLVPLLIKRTEISKTFTKESREYQQINDQINMLRQEIKNESMSAAKTDLMENQTLRVKRELLIKKINALNEESIDFQAKKENYKALELDVEIARKNFLKYGDKKEDSRLFAMRDEQKLSNVIIAEASTRPNRAKSPNKLLALQVSIFLGFFAALILPFILETLDHKLKTSDDVENVLSLPVVCTYNEL